MGACARSGPVMLLFQNDMRAHAISTSGYRLGEVIIYEGLFPSKAGRAGRESFPPSVPWAGRLMPDRFLPARPKVVILFEQDVVRHALDIIRRDREEGRRR